jgi:anti-sigma28 factor (negative regulator of flagellin synthesis)
MRNQAQQKKPAKRPVSQRESILESGFATVAPPAGPADEVEIDWVKVEMLRAAIDRGSYAVDPRAVAEALIDRALAQR